MYERARYRLSSPRLSPLGQFARWLFERQRVPYRDAIHAVACKTAINRTGGVLPGGLAVASAEGAWGTCGALLDDLDARSRAGSRVLGETRCARDEVRRECLAFHDQLCQQSERIFLFHIIDDPTLAVPMVSAGAPLLQRLYVRWLYPFWKRRAIRAYDLTKDQIAQDIEDVRAAFRLAGTRRPPGQPFGAGATPSTADLAFAAFSALVLLPDTPGAYGVPLPKPEHCPADFAKLVQALRASPAAALAMAVYAAVPPGEQLLPDPRNRKLKALGLRRNPRLLLVLARTVRRLFPVIRLGKLVIVSRHKAVTESLRRDQDFLIAPVNGRRIGDVNHGPFILGLDAGPQHDHEYARLYAAYRPYDIDRVRAVVNDEATRLLDGAGARDGNIDVVNSYARLAAARTAVLLFGITGPSEADLARVVRRMFQHSFLNILDRPVTRARAIEASLELKQWVEEEIARRRASGDPKDDLLGRMLRAEPGPHSAAGLDLIRRNISGLLVGAIDTTATSVSNICTVLLTRPDIRHQVEADIAYPARFRSWCWEVLRLWPHNPLLFRRSGGCPVHLGSAAIGKNKKIVALTLAAMHDPAAFPNPERLELGRPETSYLHFGFGLHTCAGLDFNRVQVPELVRLLLLRAPELQGRLQFEGPFPDQLIVKLRML